jgi:chemotaxis protein MotB
MARKKKHEEHENHERWLVSYADFITLLFAFFVVMYSLSAINEGKFRVLAESLQAAFQTKQRSHEPISIGHPSRPNLVDSRMMHNAPQVPMPMPPPVPNPIPMVNQASGGAGADGPGGQAMREIADRVEKAMAPLIQKDLVTVKRYRFWLEVEIKTNILFGSGSALLDRQAMPVLKEIAGILSTYPNRIQVEGHTDDQPIRNAVYPSNWELSAARAMSVVHMFARAGIKPDRLSAVGYGEHRPIADNENDEARARNRRVILVVLADQDDAGRIRQTGNETAPAPAAPEVSAPPKAAETTPVTASTPVVPPVAPIRPIPANNVNGVSPPALPGPRGG